LFLFIEKIGIYCVPLLAQSLAHWYSYTCINSEFSGSASGPQRVVRF